MAEILDANGNKVLNPNLDTCNDNDGLLTSWLLRIMTEEVLGMSLRAKFAYQVWQSPEEQLLPITKEKEIHLTDRLLSLKKGSLSNDEYLRKFKAIYDSLAAVKKPIDDVEKVLQLVEGLSSEYREFKVVMLTKPLIQSVCVITTGT